MPVIVALQLLSLEHDAKIQQMLITYNVVCCYYVCFGLRKYRK